MRRPLRLLAVGLGAAALALLWLAGSPAVPSAAAKPPKRSPRPVIVSAGPVHAPSDRAGGGYRRVTFSPDGDGRDDVVRIRVRARPGDRLSLWLHPESQSPVYIPAGTAAKGVTQLVWNGLQADGSRYPDGSYILRVCDTTSHYCSTLRVLAHLRIITIYARQATAVSSGQTIRVHISTDRAGPYLLDLVPVTDVTGAGIGAETVASTGWVDYRVPEVPHGGLWLLRARSGSQVTHFPLVVHEPTLRLDDPPPGTALVVYPYLTWRAYDMYDENRDGVVDSWYAHPRTPVVPLYGPFEPLTSDPAAKGREPNPDSQTAFALWLQEHRLKAQHVTDVELGRFAPNVLQKYAMIVFEGHTEYYQLGTYEKVLRYRNDGGHLYFLQGNSFYGRVQIVGTNVWRRSYRYRTAKRSDFAIAVGGFRSCCWPSTVRPVYHLAPGAVEALPWAFAGTDLKDGDEFGIAAGEVDTIDPKLSPPGTVTVATATVPAFQPTSEKEVNGWIGSRPIPYKPSWLTPQRIAIAYAAVGQGEVFTWGNTGFMKTVMFGGYGIPSAERAALDRVALDVWEHLAR